MTVVTPPKFPYTYNYELYVWLSEDKTNSKVINFLGEIFVK